MKTQSELQKRNDIPLLDWEEKGINPMQRLARFLKVKRMEKINSMMMLQDTNDENEFIRRTYAPPKRLSSHLSNKSSKFGDSNKSAFDLGVVYSLMKKLGIDPIKEPKPTT